MKARYGTSMKSYGVDLTREKAFQKARGHTRTVKALRILLPITSILMLASYGVSFETAINLKDGALSLDAFRYSNDVLTAENPKYEGFDKDGTRFFVTAKVAEQDIKQAKPVKLTTISGSITEASGNVTNLTADHGFYDLKSKVLDLRKEILVTSTGGMRANLTQAFVQTDKGQISSSQPVLLAMPSGTIHGNQMDMDQKKRTITFYNGVRTHLLPPAQSPSGEIARTAKQGQDGQVQAFGDPTKPTDITSAKLVVDDTAKIATFSGNVRATQDDTILESPELVVRYMSDEAKNGPEKTSADITANGKIKSILARENIVLRQTTGTAKSLTAEFRPLENSARLVGSVIIESHGSGRVTSDAADLNTASDTAVLTGSVVVTQERNELRGRRLKIDRRAGTSVLTSPGDNNESPAPISARLYQTANQAADGKLRRQQSSNWKTSGTSSGLTGTTSFQTDPNAPIDILATRFESDDQTGKATFTGDVQAQQGTVQLKSNRLIASYTGGSLTGASQGTGSAAGKTPPAARISAIRAEENVHIKSAPDQEAHGDWADFDIQKNTVTLGGKVSLIRGKQIIRGPKLVIDLTSGVSRMETGAKAPANHTGNATAFAPRPGELPDPAKKPLMPKLQANPTAQTECPPGRMCMLLFQDDTTTKKPAGAQPQPRSKSGWSTNRSPAKEND